MLINYDDFDEKPAADLAPADLGRVVLVRGGESGRTRLAGLLLAVAEYASSAHVIYIDGYGYIQLLPDSPIHVAKMRPND